MKRLICLLLSGLLLLGMLVSCKDPKPEEGTKSYTFKKGAVEIAIDADAAPLLTALGAYKTYDATPSCAFAGEDKVYVYDGFKLQTYQKTAGGTDYVYSVVLTDDTYATPEGITIGSAAALVTETYGNPEEKTDAKISYATERETLLFLIKDGKVTSIQYLKKT